MLEAPPLEMRREPRPATANGRRRRRRTRGGQRPVAPQDEAVLLPEELAEEEEDVEEIEYTPPDDLLIPDLVDDEQADAVFDELLERVEDEEAESRALAALDPLEIMEPPSVFDEVVPTAEEIASAAGDEAVAEEQAPAPNGEAVSGSVSQPFTAEEWELLSTIVARHERPISFAQIHDALRDARKSADIVRTNEELRTLIKQAINSGMLERSGKGNRVTYRLAPQPAAEAEGVEADVEAAEVAETATQAEREQPELYLPEVGVVVDEPLEEPVGTPEQPETVTPEADEQPAFYTPEAAAQAELIAPPEFTTPDEERAAEVAGTAEQSEAIAPEADEQPAFYTPEAAAQAQMTAPPQVAPVEVITEGESALAETTPTPPRRSRARRKPAAETAPAPSVEPAGEAAPTKGQRGRSKKSAAASAAEAPAQAEPTARKRGRPRKTEDSGTSGK
jgi:hypothetical protein